MVTVFFPSPESVGQRRGPESVGQRQGPESVGQRQGEGDLGHDGPSLDLSGEKLNRLRTVVLDISGS